jgi:hypothetical protein
MQLELQLKEIKGVVSQVDFSLRSVVGRSGALMHATTEFSKL